jgi:hypothetical protein
MAADAFISNASRNRALIMGGNLFRVVLDDPPPIRDGLDVFSKTGVNCQVDLVKPAAGFSNPLAS